jgi:beta-lactam-binding protein with PASTA domain
MTSPALGLALVALAQQKRAEGAADSTSPTALAPSRPAGPAVARVPDLSQEIFDQADAELSYLGLVAQRRDVRTTDLTYIGTVTDTFPEAGTVVKVGTKVRVDVNVGLPVPKVTGLKKAAAETTLTDRGFQVETVTEGQAGVSPDTVWKQDPAAGGTLSAAGQKVKITATPPAASAASGGKAGSTTSTASGGKAGSSTSTSA